jgi:hypothetical protein
MGAPEYQSAFTKQQMDVNPPDPKLASMIKNSHMGFLFDPAHGTNPRSMGQSTYKSHISDQAKLHPHGVPTNEHMSLHRTNFVVGFDRPALQSEASAE